MIPRPDPAMPIRPTASAILIRLLLGLFLLRAIAHGAPPPNDNFTNAIVGETSNGTTVRTCWIDSTNCARACWPSTR